MSQSRGNSWGSDIFMGTFSHGLSMVDWRSGNASVSGLDTAEDRGLESLIHRSFLDTNWG